MLFAPLEKNYLIVCVWWLRAKHNDDLIREPILNVMKLLIHSLRAA